MKKEMILLGMNTETIQEVKMQNKNRYLSTLLLGSFGEEKIEYVIEPLLVQDFENKEVGVTIFDRRGDTTEIAFALAKKKRRKIIHFNPFFKNVKINPLKGSESDAIDALKILCNDDPSLPQYFKSMNERLIELSITVLKRLYGNKVNLIEFSRFLHNVSGNGRKMVTQFSRLNTESEEISKENADISAWFLNEYFNEKSKTYEHTTSLRVAVSQFLSNKTISNLFNMNTTDECLEVDFTKHVKEKDVVILDLQGLKLGASQAIKLENLLLHQYQKAIVAQDKVVPNHLYIGELFGIHLPTFINLLSFSERFQIAILAEIQKCEDFSLISSFRNLFIMPGTFINDSSQLSNGILKQEDIDCINVLKLGEFFFRIIDRESKGFIQKGIIKANALSSQEKEFLDKRIKRYRKEFSKQQ